MNFLYIPAFPKSNMQLETDHTKYKTHKGCRYLLCLILLIFLFAGCQRLAHKPDAPPEQTPTKEFGLLRESDAPPVEIGRAHV